MPLKQQILNYLKDKDFVHKGELGRMAVLDWGYENENMGRRCRELENDGLIVKKLNDKREVLYKIAPQATQCDYRGLNKKDDILPVLTQNQLFSPPQIIN